MRDLAGSSPKARNLAMGRLLYNGNAYTVSMKPVATQSCVRIIMNRPHQGSQADFAINGRRQGAQECIRSASEGLTSQRPAT